MKLLLMHLSLVFCFFFSLRSKYFLSIPSQHINSMFFRSIHYTKFNQNQFNIVMDLLKVFLGNGSVNTFQRATM
jgi:hypothetical protein